VVFFSIGLQGRFARWCDAVVARLAGHLDGTVTVKSWPSLTQMLGYDPISSVLQEVALTLIGTNAEHLVIGVRQPDERLCATLAETSTRFVLALDDPRVSFADILSETGAEPRLVTRAIANSCPLMMRYASLPGTLAMTADRTAADSSGAVLELASHFGITVDTAEVQTIVAELGGPNERSAGGDAGFAGIPEQARKMVDGALADYGRTFIDGVLKQIVWTRDLFSLAVDSSKPPTELLDVSGGSRILIYGPYIQLPTGSWTAQITLGFSEEAGRYNFLVDAYAGHQLACTSFQPQGGGIYVTNINFFLAESSGPGIEIRVIVASENARGHLAFGQVLLTPLAMRHPDTETGSSDDFRAVLEI
jgi:hypothetical protein